LGSLFRLDVDEGEGKDMQTLVWAGGLLLTGAAALEMLVGVKSENRITVLNDDPAPYLLWIQQSDDFGPGPLLFLMALPPGGFQSPLFETAEDAHHRLVLTDPSGVIVDVVNLGTPGDPSFRVPCVSYTVMRSHLVSS
jgi:uncharacterized protein (DUF3820 family)